MGSTHFLPKIAGPQVAARMLLTGEVISGSEAARVGVVASSHPDAEATVEEAVKLAKQMASQGPAAVRTCVRSLRMAQDVGLEQALWREADAQAQCYGSGDLREGVTAVQEKRRPKFAAPGGLGDAL